MPLFILILSISLSQVWAVTLIKATGRPGTIEVQETPSELRFKTPQLDIAIDRIPCSRPAVDRLIKTLDRLWAKSLSVTSEDGRAVRYRGKDKLISPLSPLVEYLDNSNVHFVVTKKAAEIACRE